MANDPEEEAIKQLTDHDILPAAEQRELCRLSQAGDSAARHKLVECNMKLVLSQVKKFCSSTQDPRFMDLLQAGTIGFLTAVDKFDLTRESAVSTYAVWWIKAKIRDELAKTGSKVLRFKSLHNKFKRTRYRLLKETKCQPLDEEVFAELEWNEETIKKFQIAQDTQLVSMNQMDPTDLHNQSGLDDSDTDTGEKVLVDLITSERSDSMYAALQELDATTRGIIMRHYGIGYEDTATYDQLATIFSMTRERVRLIENEGLRQIYFLMEFPQ